MASAIAQHAANAALVIIARKHGLEMVHNKWVLSALELVPLDAARRLCARPFTYLGPDYILRVEFDFTVQLWYTTPQDKSDLLTATLKSAIVERARILVDILWRAATVGCDTKTWKTWTQTINPTQHFILTQILDKDMQLHAKIVALPFMKSDMYFVKLMPKAK